MIKTIIFLGQFVILAVIQLAFGFRRERSRYNSDVCMDIISATIILFLTTFLSGLAFGFLRSAYDMSILGILKNVGYNLIIIILTELSRYMLIFKYNKNIIKIVLIAIAFTAVDSIFVASITNFNVAKSLVMFIVTSLFPSISKNILLIYLSKKVGYTACILYRSITELYIYIFPIIPNLGDYLNAIIFIIFPLILFYRFYKLITPPEQQKLYLASRKKTLGSLTYVMSSIFIIVTTYLVSNLFRFGLLVIVTDSMIPTINMGDIIITDKDYKKHPEKIAVGDILTFDKNKKTMAHRVVSIEIKDDKYFYTTKGDNNNCNDNEKVAENEIIGVIKLIIPCIGYPSYLLHRFTG